MTDDYEEDDHLTDDGPNVPMLQETLDRLTADLSRWNQGSYCMIPDGIENLSEQHLETGAYHDFRFSPEVIKRLKIDHEQDRLYNLRLPIADCGTALCVAGDVVVHQGYTFVGIMGEDTTSEVVPADRVNDYLLHYDNYEYSSLLEEADDVARRLLNITLKQSMRLFEAGKNLLEIWAIGYAISNGQLRLPDRLPRTTHSGSAFTSEATPAYDTPAAVAAAVHERLAIYVVTYGWRDFKDVVNVDLLPERLREQFEHNSIWV